MTFIHKTELVKPFCKKGKARPKGSRMKITKKMRGLVRIGTSKIIDF